MPVPEAEFVSQTATAYQHLYDLVFLRRYPFADRLTGDPDLPPKDRAWRAHHVLLDAIDALDPGPNAPAHSREWRRHRLMVLRYVEGLEVQVVADELGISKRHYFREHDAAIEAVASVLAQSLAARSEAPERPAGDGQPPLERIELLRLEAARLARSRRQASLPEVVRGAVGVAQEMARSRDVGIKVQLAGGLPPVATDRNTLRQLLLGLLSLLLERLQGGRVAVDGVVEDGRAVLCLRACGAAGGEEVGLEGEEQVRLSMLNELATLQSVRLEPLRSGGHLEGFRLELPTAPARTILIVDDNEDAVRLLQLHLSRHNYQVAAASSGAEALQKARELQPFAITLDLMMPERDGWDVLQTLTNQPATQHIPVIVCTVLSAEQMALALGATAFLAKPVSEQDLLATLAALE